MKFSLCLFGTIAMFVVELLLSAVTGSAVADDRSVAMDTDVTAQRRAHRVKRLASNQLTNNQRALFLDEHNRLRRSVVPGASNMLEMVWNAELESLAQDWAERCVYEHGLPGLPKQFDNVGQNLWVGTGPYTPERATAPWFNENKTFSYSSNQCEAGAKCGHYTQMAWANSYSLGCSIVFCASIQVKVKTYVNAHYIVCNYGPAGNWIGSKPYKAGGACSECPQSNTTCVDGLCRTNPACSAVTECTPTNQANCLCDESYYRTKLDLISSSAPTLKSASDPWIRLLTLLLLLSVMLLTL